MKPVPEKPFDPLSITARTGSGYPAPFDELVSGREKRALGNAVGLKNFGVNLVVLHPESASSQRHHHSKQDEFIYVLSGEITLCTDDGKQNIKAGECIGFPSATGNGHHLINESDSIATYIEIGDRTPGDQADYPDIDLVAKSENGRYKFYHKDGKPYPEK